MKFVFIILTLFTVSGFVLAAELSVPVKTSQVAPWSCSNAQDSAIRDLRAQCKAIDMTLKESSLVSCTKTGDDGGYVEYFTAEATGQCSDTIKLTVRACVPDGTLCDRLTSCCGTCVIPHGFPSGACAGSR